MKKEKLKDLKNKTIKGSLKFLIIVFEPHKKMMVSTRLCICDDWQQHYGSCKMLKEYDLNVQQLKTTCLQSGLLSVENLGVENDYQVDDHERAQIINEIFVPCIIVALAAKRKSPKAFYLIKITKEYDTKYYDGCTIKKAKNS